MVCPATVTASLRVFSFWQRWHSIPSSASQNTACQEAGSNIIAALFAVSRLADMLDLRLPVRADVSGIEARSKGF
jgi:hypothetical protein